MVPPQTHRGSQQAPKKGDNPITLAIKWVKIWSFEQGMACVSLRARSPPAQQEKIIDEQFSKLRDVARIIE